MFYSLRSTEIFNIKDFIDDQFKKLINREQLYQPNKGSGWTLKRCKELSLKLNKHILLNAGSHIELPEQIKSKKACINFANKDNYCFIYSIRCAINKPNKNAERVKQYEKYINDEIFKGFDYPMSLKDIKIFEKRSFDPKYNYPSISINVYSLGENLKIVPLQVSEIYNAKLEIDLLYYTVEDNSHYILISNLSALVGSQLSKNINKKHICRRCLCHFYSINKLSEHLEICKTHEPCKPIMPIKGQKVEFRNFNKKFKHPFVVYLDFESILEKITVDTSKLFPNKPYTNKIQKHVPYGFTIYLVSEKMYKPICYRAKTEEELIKVPEILFENLDMIAKYISKKYNKPKPIIITKDEEIEFQKSDICHICECVITEVKV